MNDSNNPDAVRAAAVSVETFVVLVARGTRSDVEVCRMVASRAACVGHVVALNDVVLDVLLPSTNGLADLAQELLAVCPLLAAGVSVGDVIVGPGTVDGLPVVEAARLSSIAMPGDVLVHPRVLRLAPALQSRPFGAVNIKGLAGDVDVQRLLLSDDLNVGG